MSHFRPLLAVLAACVSLLAVAPSASAASSLNFPPDGANDFSCKPTPAHPRPVVLVHGLAANMAINWAYMGPKLKAEGYCVFALTYGLDPRIAALGGPGGLISVDESAQELKAFVDRVLAATGAKRIDLVGHSEGTFMPQVWLRELGGAPKVARYVAMTPLYGGTNVGGLAALRDLGDRFGLAAPIISLVNTLCTSCTQFLVGSPTQKRLVVGGAAAPGVEYTTILTRYDELVVPYTSGLLPPPATNIVLQDVCPADLSEHAAVAVDPNVFQLVRNALDPKHALPVRCSIV